MIDKLNRLILEAQNHKFENNSLKKSHGIFSRPGVDLQVWIAEVEDFIISYYGIESVPGQLFSRFDRQFLYGYNKDAFDKQLDIIISALKVCLKISPKEQNIVQLSQSKFNYSKVFIVHGHDETAKTKAARFVEKLGLEAIILHEQASSSKTIIEKIEEYSNVGFGIILYTPCDLGGKQSPNPTLKSRARQNVVFEHGFLIGKIGRSNVCALVKGELETPNDISGVVYIQMDDSEAWHYKVGKELKKVGYNVDLNRL